MQRQRTELFKFRANVLQRVSILRKDDYRFIDSPQKPQKRLYLAFAHGGDSRQYRQAFEPLAFLRSVTQSGNSQFEQPTGSIAAAAVVVTIPIVIMVLVFQRRIVAGLTAGAVKG